jgi:hypothetical protein
MNSNDKLNRSRPGRAAKAALAARHARKCVICKHPEREAIEEQFVHWIHADRIVQDHDLRSMTTLYRHAHATGLFNLRRYNMRYALEHLIEDAIHAPVSGDCVIRAIRAHARLTAKGRWIEDPPKELILSRRVLPAREAAAGGQSHLQPGRLKSANAPEPVTNHLLGDGSPKPDPVTRQQTGNAVREMEAATRDSFPLSLPDRPSGPSIAEFLIGTPKRLETPATETKQTSEATSNRYENDTPEKPAKPASESPATSEYRPIRFADTPRTRRIGRFVVHKPNQSESAATETKQTTDLVSDRNNSPAP